MTAADDGGPQVTRYLQTGWWQWWALLAGVLGGLGGALASMRWPVPGTVVQVAGLLLLGGVTVYRMAWPYLGPSRSRAGASPVDAGCGLLVITAAIAAAVTGARWAIAAVIVVVVANVAWISWSLRRDERRFRRKAAENLAGLEAEAGPEVAAHFRWALGPLLEDRPRWWRRGR